MGVLCVIVRMQIVRVSALCMSVMRVAIMPIARHLRPVGALVDPAADVGGLT